MDHRNLDKAMEIFACLITGETVGKDNHRDGAVAHITG